jgi:hypothetical protein
MFLGGYDIKNYEQSPDLQRVKQSLLQGQAPHECRPCVRNERLSGSSLRVIYEKFHSDVSDRLRSINQATHSEIENLMLNTSNICNLKCLHCSGTSARDLELYNMGLLPNVPILHKAYDQWQVLKSFPIRKLTLLGGEPFYDRVTFDILQSLVDQGRSQDISIDLNTNMTGITRQKVQWLADNFRETVIKASIDGFGIANDYLRYPCVWTEITEAVDIVRTQPRVTFMVTTALSNLGIMTYPQLLAWGMSLNINMFLTPVTMPAAMHVHTIPQPIKDIARDRLLDLQARMPSTVKDRTQNCVNVALNICQQSEFDAEAWQASLAWYQQHDQRRGNDLLSAFPDLAPYV